jgi:hypothetical protein
MGVYMDTPSQLAWRLLTARPTSLPTHRSTRRLANPPSLSTAPRIDYAGTVGHRPEIIHAVVRDSLVVSGIVAR